MREDSGYTGIYHFAGGTEFEELVAQEAGSVEDIIKKCNELGQKLGKPVIFLGDGVPVYKDIIEELCNVESLLRTGAFKIARERERRVAIRAMKLYEEGEAEASERPCADLFKKVTGRNGSLKQRERS